MSRIFIHGLTRPFDVIQREWLIDLLNVTTVTTTSRETLRIWEQKVYSFSQHPFVIDLRTLHKLLVVEIHQIPMILVRDNVIINPLTDASQPSHRRRTRRCSCIQQILLSSCMHSAKEATKLTNQLCVKNFHDSLTLNIGIMSPFTSETTRIVCVKRSRTVSAVPCCSNSLARIWMK